MWANVGGASGSLSISLLTQRAPVRFLTVEAMLFGAASVVWFGQGQDTGLPETSCSLTARLRQPT